MQKLEEGIKNMTEERVIKLLEETIVNLIDDLEYQIPIVDETDTFSFFCCVFLSFPFKKLTKVEKLRRNFMLNYLSGETRIAKRKILELESTIYDTHFEMEDDEDREKVLKVYNEWKYRLEAISRIAVKLIGLK